MAFKRRAGSSPASSTRLISCKSTIYERFFFLYKYILLILKNIVFRGFIWVLHRLCKPVCKPRNCIKNFFTTNSYSSIKTYLNATILFFIRDKASKICPELKTRQYLIHCRNRRLSNIPFTFRAGHCRLRIRGKDIDQSIKGTTIQL